MCKHIDHFPEETDYEADPSEYFLREYFSSSSSKEQMILDVSPSQFPSGCLSQFWLRPERVARSCCSWPVSRCRLPAFSTRLAGLSPAKQLICFYCLAVCNITCGVIVSCVPCKHRPLILALFPFVQAGQGCLLDSFVC